MKERLIPRMKKAIVFDMDGVLFNTQMLSNKAWFKLADERGMGDIRNFTNNCVGRNRTDIISIFNKYFGENFDAEGFLNAGRALMQEWIERDGLPLMKGTREILQYLREEEYTVALASSSGTKAVLSHLKASGLTDYFQAIIGGDQVRLSKPKPDIYLKACEAIGKKPKESMAIEDSPNGIRAAYAAGMTPIMIPDQIEPDEEILTLVYKKYDSLLELKDALEAGEL